MNAVIRFHLRVGIRLALRIFVPAVAVFFALYYLLRPELFNSLMAQILYSGFLLSGIMTAFICIVAAGFASRRICLGLNGWIRHLPIKGIVHRRLASIANLVAQTPVLATLAGLAVAAMRLYEVQAASFIVGLPFVGLACGLFVLPAKRKFFARPLAALAAIGFASNDWVGFGGGLIFLIAADAIAGPLVKKAVRSRLYLSLKGILLIATINGRALGMRPLVLYSISLPFLGAARLFIANNDPAPLLSEQMIRFGGSLGLVLFLSLSANMLASRRPPWPWIRSFPWSAKTRILWDSCFIGVHAIPILVLVGLMSARSMLPLLLSLPFLAAYASYSIRKAPESATGASGKILLLGALGSLLLCLIPWSSLFFMILTPMNLNWGAKADKHQKVSRWLELHHLSAGDSLSWSE